MGGVIVKEENDIRLKIIGVQEVYKKEREMNSETSAFIFGFLSRVREIDYGGKIGRLIRYDVSKSDSEAIGFLGLEVENITYIPEGMTAWKLTSDTWQVLEQENGVNKVISQHGIGWRWVDDSSTSGLKKIVGDFYIISESSMSTNLNDYLITVNAYYDFNIPMENEDRVEIIEYDPSWIEEYKKFEEWFVSSIGTDIAFRIEHIGSTAIPGMPAKPCIDIAVEVLSYEDARQRIIPLMNDETWEYWRLKDHDLFYKRSRLMGKRTHYLHVGSPSHNLWNRVAFRDYLKNNLEYANQYTEMKRRLAISSQGNWLMYTNDKSDFVQEITLKALEEYEMRSSLETKDGEF